MFNSTPVASQVTFATNTPEGDTSVDVNATTSKDANGFSFATNTPANATTSLETSTPTPSPTPMATPVPIGPFTYPEGYNPLTGLPYPNEEAKARRNLIVKISNFPPVVRPQNGVNQADVVVEYEAEGGVTRFAAIFRSNNPNLVGSIRSARLMDMELVTIFQALLAYSGTSEPIQQLLLASDFKWQLVSPSIGHNCDNAGFCRADLPERAFEHTLFGDTNKMWAIADNQGVNTGYIVRGFAFGDEPDPSDEFANDIFINWFGQTDARWIYNDEQGQYLRYTDGLPHFDASDDTQLFIDNLIVLEVPHVRRPDLFPEGATYESLEIQLWDQGRALVYRDGHAYQGFWRRQDRNPGSGIQLIYGSNTPILLKPGRSWVSVVRSIGDVTASVERSDMVATATVLAMSATPTPTQTPTPSQ